MDKKKNYAHERLLRLCFTAMFGLTIGVMLVQVIAKTGVLKKLRPYVM